MNSLAETITGKTNSSVMTDENSAIMIAELQDTENQIDANSAAIVADLKVEKN